MDLLPIGRSRREIGKAMETIDPKKMPRMIHVIPRQNKWRVKWSDGKKALRILGTEKEALEFAKDRAKGEYSVIVHMRSGFVDVEKCIMTKHE